MIRTIILSPEELRKAVIGRVQLEVRDVVRFNPETKVYDDVCDYDVAFADTSEGMTVAVTIREKDAPRPASILPLPTR